MNRVFLYGVLIAFLVGCFNCEPEAERPAEGPLNLQFSADTILFDTLFTEVRSITKRFRVFNNSDRRIDISEISLEERENSSFKVIINGEEGVSFSNISILGNDSLLILVEANIDARDENLPFIIEDAIIFGNQEDYRIPLVAWGQDAIFLRDIILPCDYTFSREKPYVLYGSVLVDSLCTLMIDPGARIYGHFNSNLFVAGTIAAQGTAENRILFRNDRLDENFQNAPGQWGGIFLLEGSKNNQIIYTDIRNAQVGVRVGTPDDDDIYDLVIGNSRIENISNTGLLSFTSDVYMYNCLINNCGISAVAAVAGGNYRFVNNTIAGFSFDFFREDASLILSDNIVLADNSLLVEDLNAEVINNIIWGSLADEIVISNTEGAGEFTVRFESNLIRSSTDSLGANNILNLNPEFIEAEEYDYSLSENSPAIDAGVSLGEIILDIFGNARDTNLDIGAIERQ